MIPNYPVTPHFIQTHTLQAILCKILERNDCMKRNICTFCAMLVKGMKLIQKQAISSTPVVNSYCGHEYPKLDTTFSLEIQIIAIKL